MSYLSPIEQFFALDRDLQRMGRHDERLGHLADGRERFPDAGRVAVNYAVALIRDDRLDEARRELATALELGIDTAEIDLAFASLHLNEQRLDLAAAAAERAEPTPAADAPIG